MKFIKRVSMIFVTAVVSTSTIFASAQMSRILEAVDMGALEAHVGLLSPETVIGWDCDNTWALRGFSDEYAQFNCLEDFEMLRELLHYWTRAGEQLGFSAELQKGEAFARKCCYEDTPLFPREYTLLDAGLVPFYQKAIEAGVESFVCTGLQPLPSKVDYLIKQGFDPSSFYAESKTIGMFAKYKERTFGGWLYAPQKARAMMDFIKLRNAERAPLITKLIYVDNDLGTLQKIDRDFKMDGVELTLIHWRKHALDLEVADKEGTLIPNMVAAYKELTRASEEEEPHSPRPGDGFDTHSGDEYPEE